MAGGSLKCWFCGASDQMSSQGWFEQCGACGELSMPGPVVGQGVPYVAHDNVSAPKHRPATAKQIAGHVSPVVPGRVPNPHGPAEFNTGLHGQPRGVPAK